VKVRRTKTYIDKEGYMVNSDYSSYEEQDESPVKPKAVKKIPASAAEKPKTGGVAAKTGAKKQTGL
jgi:hypothetical protein